VDDRILASAVSTYRSFSRPNYFPDVSDFFFSKSA
jgi:hypothetical protein